MASHEGTTTVSCRGIKLGVPVPPPAIWVTYLLPNIVHCGDVIRAGCMWFLIKKGHPIGTDLAEAGVRFKCTLLYHRLPKISRRENDFLLEPIDDTENTL